MVKYFAAQGPVNVMILVYLNGHVIIHVFAPSLVPLRRECLPSTTPPTMALSPCPEPCIITGESQGTPPTHRLMRQYARGMFALDRGCEGSDVT